MKKITYVIIVFFFAFSSVSGVFANEGYLWKILELQTGPEVYLVENIPLLPAQKFQSSSVQFTYDEVKKVDSILREEIIRQYRLGELSYYEVQDILQNYEDFLYYTKKTFEYISENEKWTRGSEIEQAIYSGYTNMRASYAKIVSIID